jgi:NAD(P)-dependent dehydrogenase (short-subunit alcohol dehydrogenase family)
MSGEKIILITGGSAGMGKATATILARGGSRVIILARNRKRGEAALQEIIQKSGNTKVHLMLCDLGSQISIRQFVKKFKETYTHLDVLINNAGVITPKRNETKEGYEIQFAVNHLGHFLLTNLLLETIIKSKPARIINVSSDAHKVGNIHFEDIHLKKGYNLIKAYAQSKLANILFTYELAERLKGTGVTVNCLHPGAVATQMGIDRKTGFGTALTGLLKPFFKTPEEGAATAVYLAASEEGGEVTGKYFSNKKAIKSSEKSYDKQLAKKLWTLSEKLVYLDKTR